MEKLIVETPQPQRLNRNASTDRIFECFICKIKCKSLQATRQHLIKNHKRDMNCSVCNQNFTVLEFEMHACTELESLICSYCQQGFKTTKNLLEHFNDCSNEKLAFKCDYCKKFYFMESLLSLHMKNHQNNFGCNLCNKSFSKKHLLQIHEKRVIKVIIQKL